ncbi:putative transcription factor interactor and regulator CCHC(Zn) family [Helianthus annuus]|nr:putative transcription factor interactor and regulator CCHC(Zn) family [Helianthus annuus]
MASPSASNNFPMPGLAPMISIKLTSSNFIYWRTQMRPLLTHQHLLPHVDGSQTAPPPFLTSNDKKETINPEYTTWIQQEQQAIILLNASLTEEALAVTVGLSSAREIWVALEAAFCNTSIERIQNLRDNLRALKKGDKNVAEYGRAFKAICDQLSAVGHPVDVMDQLHWFLCGLGTTFESFSTSVRSTRPIPSFADLLASAESHELFVKNLHESATVPSIAFVAQSARSNHNYPRGAPPHNSSNFRPRYAHARFRPNRPHGQGFRGHRDGLGNLPRSGRVPTCQLCRKTGHSAHQCFHLASYAASTNPTEDQMAQAFLAQCQVNPTVPDWTSDSGATTHMLPNNSLLQNSTPTQGPSNQANSSPGVP